MKLQKLTIHNIASIEDGRIDFASQPLSDSDVFLITGKTGSGKSTILDAICLALYGTTPRLENTSMEGAVEDVRIRVQLDSPLQLLRENTGEGWVILTFEGSDGVSYEAKWYVRRAGGKADGRLQPRQWTVTDLDSNTVCTKEDDIEPLIQKAVGLTFEQFCRTTMLAQGQFTRFLDSKDDDKAEILEKITGADIYAKIGAAVYDKADEKEKEWEAADAAIKGITVLTPEEIQSKKDELEVKKKEMEAARSSRDEAARKAGWLEEDATLKQQKAEADKALENAESAVKTEDYKEKKALVDSWKETADARQDLKTASEQKETAAAARQALDRLAGRYIAVRSGLAFLSAKEVSLQKDLDLIESAGKGIPVPEGEEKSRAVALIQAKVKADKDFAAASEKKGRTADALKSAEKALEDAGLGEVRRKKNELTAEQGHIAVALERLKHLGDAKAAREKEKKEIDAEWKRLEGITSEIAGKKAEAEKLAAQAKAAKERYDAVSSAVENFIGDIRNKLKVGEVCPVCMREITTALPSDAEVAERVAPVKKAWDEAREAYETYREALRNMEASYKTDKANCENRKAKYDKAKEDVEKLKEDALTAVRTCGMDIIDENTAGKLSQRKEEIKGLLEVLREKEKAGEIFESSLQEARKADENARKELDDARDAAAQAGNAVDREKAETERQKTLVKKCRETVADILSDVETSVPVWKSKQAGPAAELKDIENVARALSGEVIKECQNESTALEASNRATGNVETFLKEHTAYDLAALERLAAIDGKTINQREEALQKLDNAVTQKKGALDAILKQVTEHESKRPAFSEGDTKESLKAQKEAFDASFASLAVTVSDMDKEIKDDEDNIKKAGQLALDAGKLREERDLWDRLNQLIGDATGKKFRKIAQSYVLGSLVDAANHYVMDLTSDRYTLKVIPGTFVILLEDAWQGYASRPASTISGGETFLVSLSLALALSDIGDGLSVDTMFIDEGFGTLSGEPLQKAVDTLKTLHTKGNRHIGIISHIEDLQDKIPVKVKIEMDPSTASSTVEVVSGQVELPGKKK